MQNNIISLAKELISIRSVDGNKQALEEVLTTALSHLEEFTIERFEHNGIPSVLVYPTKTRPKTFKILLNGHLDVVPGKEYQYSPVVKDNKLYGVGSMDMKANAASLIMAFKAVAGTVTYPLGLQLVTDEEIGGFDGTKHQVDQGVRAEFVIAGEPTNFNIVHKAKGILWVKISTTGKTAHGAYPWRGENAIWKMNTFLNKLQQRFPIPDKEVWATTLNLSRIETTNSSFNKIPDDCTVSLDIRYVPEDKDTIVGAIKELVPEGFAVEFLFNEPTLFVSETNPYITRLKAIDERITGKKVTLYGANGSSDARHFTRVNCDGIEFGPIGGEIGTDEEWVDINSLEQYYQILKEFLLSYS